MSNFLHLPVAPAIKWDSVPFGRMRVGKGRGCSNRSPPAVLGASGRPDEHARNQWGKVPEGLPPGSAVDRRVGLDQDGGMLG